MTDEKLKSLAKFAGLEGEATPQILLFVRNIMGLERLECLRILNDKRLSRFGVEEQIRQRGNKHE